MPQAGKQRPEVATAWRLETLETAAAQEMSLEGAATWKGMETP